MRRVILVLLCLSLPAAASAAELRKEFQPLAFLVGSCWTGTFPDGKATDTHCFEPMFDGQFIRDTHVVHGAKGQYRGETIYGWNAQKRLIVYTYWASDGGMSSGTVTSQDGDIVFADAYSSDAGPLEIKSVFTPHGAGSYDFWSAKKQNGQWAEMFRMTMRRDAKSAR